MTTSSNSSLTSSTSNSSCLSNDHYGLDLETSTAMMDSSTLLRQLLHQNILSKLQDDKLYSGTNEPIFGLNFVNFFLNENLNKIFKGKKKHHHHHHHHRHHHHGRSRHRRQSKSSAGGGQKHHHHSSAISNRNSHKEHKKHRHSYSKTEKQLHSRLGDKSPSLVSYNTPVYAGTSCSKPNTSHQEPHLGYLSPSSSCYASLNNKPQPQGSGIGQDELDIRNVSNESPLVIKTSRSNERLAINNNNSQSDYAKNLSVNNASYAGMNTNRNVAKLLSSSNLSSNPNKTMINTLNNQQHQQLYSNSIYSNLQINSSPLSSVMTANTPSMNTSYANM
jgi:hypothetical protein